MTSLTASRCSPGSRSMGNGAGRDTRERVLDAAERLFATRGIDAHPAVVTCLGVFDASTDRYLRVLARATPGTPEPERVLRFAVAKYLAYRMLGQPDGPIQTWVRRHGVGIDDPVGSLIDLVTS